MNFFKYVIKKFQNFLLKKSIKLKNKFQTFGKILILNLLFLITNILIYNI